MPTRTREGLLASVREFVATEVVPTAPALEHADAYPHQLVARMRERGLFGALVPTEYGGLGLDVTTYARVIEEICRGFMSLAGVLNSHTMAALIVLHHGTDEQRGRLLPRFASGEARGGLCLTEPHAGSDVQAIRTVARRDGDRYRISGSKMFVTNGREGNTFALLALTDPSAKPPHKGMSCFIVEKGEPGLHVVKLIAKLGYKGVDTAELLFEDFPVPASNLVGGVPGRGFKHVMSVLETGRINIAARAVGVAQAALNEAARHESEFAETQPALADIATRQAPVERVSDDARAFLETWQDIGELLESATPEERMQILQHYIEVVELGLIDPQTRTGSYAMRLFPEVRPDRGFDFGRDSGPDDTTPSPETTNGAAPAIGGGSVVVNPGRLGSHNRPESSPSRTRTYNKPVNSRLLYH